MVSSINSIMYNLELLNKQNSKVTYSLSSGEALQYGSDDSSKYNSILSIKNNISSYTAIQTNIQSVSSYNTMSDVSISEIKTNFESINSEILRAATDTTSNDDKESIANQIEALKDSIYSLLNDSTNNQYLFSGINTTTQPFVKDETTGVISYVGSLENRTVNVEKNNYSDIGVSGLDLMYYTSNQATNGGSFTFSENDIILDEDNNQYSLLDTNNDGNYDGLYLNGDSSSTPINITQNSDGTFSATNNINSNISVKHSYFDDLDELINALKFQDSSGNSISEDEASTLLSNALDKFETAYNNLNVNHAKLGSRTSIINNYESIISSKLTHYNILQEETASADLTALAVQSQALENTYTALYATINKINNLSLVKYLS